MLTPLVDWAGVPINDLPHLSAWIDRMVARPGIERGRHVPTKHTVLENRHLSEEELEKAAEKSRAWVQKGMQEDAKK